MNPLIVETGLPDFLGIEADDAVPAIETLIAENRETLKKLLKQAKFTWDNLIYPFELMRERTEEAWSLITHMHSVQDTPGWRKEFKIAFDKMVAYETEIEHNEALFQAVSSIKKDEYPQLTVPQQKVIDIMLRNFRLSGVHLSPEDKHTYLKLHQSMGELGTQFQNNLSDATHRFFYHLKSDELAGLPTHVVQYAEQEARKRGLTGQVLTLEQPIYMAVMAFAKSRVLRELFYKAHTTRASDQGADPVLDNTLVIYNVLSKRQRLAHLLNFETYANLSLATKTAKSPEEVVQFLENLVSLSHKAAKEEFETLQNFAHEMDNLGQLQAWDIAYYQERWQEHYFNISEEELRNYFQTEKVLLGLFELTEKLFGITIVPQHEFKAWDTSVRLFTLYNANHDVVSYLYVDLYARPNKREGAWMAHYRCRYQKSDGQQEIPVVFLQCNFDAPLHGVDPGLTHDDVITLFHEYGHGLQHMLTRVTIPSVSGIENVPWDVVEVASQIMENWAWEKDVLAFISSHKQTKMPLPDDLYHQLKRSKTAFAGMHLARQLEFALFDFKLHMTFNEDNPLDIQAFIQKIRIQVAVIPTPSYNRFTHGFTHIFDGGYAAGYYSYLWAEVIACDMYQQFAAHGILNPTIGRQYLDDFLSQGGVCDPKVAITQFLGRDVSLDAFLKQKGLL